MELGTVLAILLFVAAGALAIWLLDDDDPDGPFA
jgi:hypothetical protein